MQYRLNHSLILRQEFFGGLIHSRFGGNRWEISMQDAIFLWALDQTGDPFKAAQITRVTLPESNFSPATEQFLTEGIIEIGPSQEPKVKDIYASAASLYAESQTRDYLRAPINVSLYPYMVCQMSCDFCYVSPEKWKRHAAPAEKWIAVIREAKAMGVPFISLLGGDPSLYPEIHRIIRACQEIGIKSTITTNGLRVTPAMLDALTECDLVTPTISLQSLDEHHHNATGHLPIKTLETIRRLRQAEKTCNVNLVYTQQSDQQVLEPVFIRVVELNLVSCLDLKNKFIPVI